MSRELDVRVARALGWREVPGPETDYHGRVESNPVLVPPTINDTLAYVMMPRIGVVPIHWFCKDWQSDLATAWPLFEQLGPAWCIAQSDAMGWQDDCRWWCFLPVEYGGDGTEYMAATPAAAICEAWLAQKEADDD